jgi:hypothetical protein
MSREILASFSTATTGQKLFTETRAAGVLTRRAVAVALSSTRLYAAVAGRIGARAGARYNLGYSMEQNLIDALQALIFYADLIAPDLPDNARADNFQIALDRAREALDKVAT